MERCPCCKARLDGAALCPRCRADLSKAMGAQQSARFWLAKALQYRQTDQLERSLDALERSLGLHKTELAVVFRDYLIQQQCSAVLAFLAEKHLLSAALRLYEARLLLPHSELLRNLRAFTDYLLVKQHRHFLSQR